MVSASQRPRIAALVAVLARVAGAGATGGLTVYVARTEGAEQSGRFFVLISILSGLSLLTRLGSDAYITSVIAPLGHERRGIAIGHALATSLVVGLMVAVAVIVLSGAEIAAPAKTAALLGGHDPWLLGLATLGLNAIWLAGAVSRAHGHAALSIFMETGFFSVCLFGFLVAQQLSPLSLDHNDLLVAVASIAVPWTLWAVGRLVRHSAVVDGGAVSRAFGGIFSYASTAISNGVVVLIPMQALGYFDLTEDAGIYNAALRISMLVGAFGVVIRSLAVRAYKSDEPHALAPSRSDMKQVWRSTLAWVAVSLLISTQGPLLADLLGDEFDRVGQILAPMLVAQCIYIGGSLLEVRAVLCQQRRLLNLVALTTTCIGVVSSYLLIPAWQLPGAVCAFALTVLVSRATLVVLYLRWLNASNAVGLRAHS